MVPLNKFQVGLSIINSGDFVDVFILIGRTNEDNEQPPSPPFHPIHPNDTFIIHDFHPLNPHSKAPYSYGSIKIRIGALLRLNRVV